MKNDMAMNITELHAENFEQEVVNADRPVCIDFWAPWCGPCRMLSPVIEELAAEEPAIKFCKVNVDDEPGLAAQFGVSSIPTLIFSKNGALTGRTVGFRPGGVFLYSVYSVFSGAGCSAYWCGVPLPG